MWRNNKTSWSSSVYSVESRSMLYVSVLAQISKSVGYSARLWHLLPPPNRWKTEHKILEDILRSCILDFKGSCAFKPPLCWDEVGERKLVGPELDLVANATIKKIWARMCTAQSRQKKKSYADVRRRDLEFEVGDQVFLKVAPMRGFLRFRRKGK